MHDSLRPDFHCWALARLGLQPDTTAEQARHAFLGRLADADFLPAPEAQTAFWVLGGRDPATFSPAAVVPFLQEQEETLRRDVARFAADFFQLPIAERLARWEALQQRAVASPLLRARLGALQPGLRFEAPAFPEGDPHGYLAERIQQLFVLRPSDRAARRRELLDEFAAEGSEWGKVARRLERSAPGLAALEPTLMARLTSGSRSRRNPEVKWRAQERTRKVAESMPARASRSRGGIGCWWVLVLLVFGLLRGLATQSSSTTRSTRTPEVMFPRSGGAPQPTNAWKDDRRMRYRRLSREEAEELEKRLGGNPPPWFRPEVTTGSAARGRSPATNRGGPRP